MMKRFAALLLVCGFVVVGHTAMAQDNTAGNDGAPGGHTYNESQLQQMVAPIALYPDSLVSQILIGSTYPVQVVEAYQWMQKHKGLSGTKAQAASQSQAWDPSIHGLVQFPPVIDRMFNNMDWTQNLGEAFLAQQQDVMGTIQAMRQKAYAAGNLKSDSKQNVVVQEKTIVIVPAQPQVVYVPSYNPTVVYGAAWVPATWYYPPSVYAPMALAAGVAVGAAWASESNCAWSTGHVTVNNNYYYGNSNSGAAHYNNQAGSYHGENGSVAHAGNTTAAYNSNTGEVKSYNSATGQTRSGEVTQGAHGTAVQGDDGSVAHAGNTTAAYNKNTGQVDSYNSATGNTKSGNVNNAGSASKSANTTASSSNWQHDSSQRQGQPYSNSSLNKQYASNSQGHAASRGYGEGDGGGERASSGSGGGGFGRGEGHSESAASERGWASRGGGGGGFGGGGFGRGGGGGFGRGRR